MVTSYPQIAQNVNRTLDNAPSVAHNAQAVAQTHQLSSNQRMANAVLTGLDEPTTLQAYLAAATNRGLGYEAIAKDLHTVTDGAVSLSYTTVKRWLIDFGLLEEAS